MTTTLLLISVLLFLGEIRAAPKDPEKSEKNPSCQQFTQGLSFNDSQAFGTWHLLHFKTETDKGKGDSHCVQFTAVTDEERKSLKDLIGEHIPNMDWDKLALKMQIPCASLNTNKTRDYYLERLEGDGSYRTLQVPTSTTKMDHADFHRYPMRLKIVEGQYLGMMDCHEKFIFLLGKQAPDEKMIDERLKEMIESYWPGEF